MSFLAHFVHFLFLAKTALDPGIHGISLSSGQAPYTSRPKCPFGLKFYKLSPQDIVLSFLCRACERLPGREWVKFGPSWGEGECL